MTLAASTGTVAVSRTDRTDPAYDTNLINLGTFSPVNGRPRAARWNSRASVPGSVPMKVAMKSGREGDWPRRLVMAVALLATAVVAGWSAVAPGTEEADAPADTISGERALQDLEVVAAEPHPIGSAAQRRVRDYLVAQGKELRLPTEVQRAVVDGRTVENVIVLLPGAEGAGRDVVLTAHYDSAPAAPGATDDGTPVAAMLETLRVLTEQEPLRNDVVFLFTDGEELAGPVGGLGMRAFVDDHPNADRIGVAFAFECLPESSGVYLRTTTPGDAWLVSELRAADLPVFANSANQVGDRAREGNDFAAFEPAGIVGAELLTAGDSVRYHNAGDNVAAVDPGVLQDFGDTMLTLSRHFGDLDLDAVTASDADRVYLTIPLVGLVGYPVWLAQAMAAFAAAAFAALVVVARRRHRLSLARTGLAALGVLGMVVAISAAAYGAWQALLALNPESETTLQYPDFERSTTAMVAIYLLVLVVFVAVSRWISRRTGVLELLGGALAWLVPVAVLLAIGEPLFSAVALWPFVGGVVALAVVLAVGGRLWTEVVLLALAAVPVLVVVVPLAVLDALNVEGGTTDIVPALVLSLGALLAQLMLVAGQLSGRPAVSEPATPPPPLEPSEDEHAGPAAASRAGRR
jgi:Peptidase family M28